MSNAMGFGPPDGITVYFDMQSGKLWTSTADEWVEVGTPVDPPPVDPPPPPPVLRGRLLADMTETHEGNLDGVPDGWDWAHNPKHGGGWNDPPAEYTAAVVWGQVYSSNTPVEATVEVGNLRLAFLSKSTGRWSVVQHTKPDGAMGIDGGYYKSDFAGNESRPIETTPQGTLIGTPNPAWNMHMYPNARARINNDDIAHVCMWYDARLATGSDPRARYLAGAGGDYWVSESSPYPSNTDIAIGKHRFLKPGVWTTLTAHTMSAHDLDTLPLPPVVLAGAGAVNPPPPPSGWKLPDGRPARVMFVGDSITVMMAEDPMGIAVLGSQLPFPVELVGSQTSRGIRHEGHGAWCASNEGGRCLHQNFFQADGVLQHVAEWVNASRPDIIVMNIGTNDAFVRNPYTPQQIAEAIGTVVDAVHLADPKVMVCVSQLTWHNADANPLISAVVNGRSRAGRNVRVFDQFRGFEGGDWSSPGDVHPSPSGIQKMVAATAAALTVLASAG
jgi:hypothetical protein